MIWYLKWEVVDLNPNNLVLLTSGGVGYSVWITSITFAEVSSWLELELYVYHHITESSESLFGFLEKSDKNVFEELIKISWVWWKVALQILSLWSSRLAQAVRDDDKKTIESIKWIGKKMAEKIVLELKDKDFIKTEVWVSENTAQVKIEKEVHEEVKSTLSAMWYNPRNIDKVLSRLPNWVEEVWEIISFVIKEL